MAKKPRRFIQITIGDFNEATLHALDTKGRVWRFVPEGDEENNEDEDFWTQLTDQREAPTEGP